MMLLALTGGETVTLIVAVFGLVSTLAATVISRMMDERAAERSRRHEFESRLLDQRYDAYSSVIAHFRRALPASDDAARAAAQDAYLQAWARAMLVASESVRSALERLSAHGDPNLLLQYFAAAAAADLGVDPQVLTHGTKTDHKSSHFAGGDAS